LKIVLEDMTCSVEYSDMNAGTEDTKQVGERVSDRERRVLDAVRGIRFGSVEIVVHDGQVVQIERKEKVRFAQ
jgi:hypothetical protein